MLVLSHQRANDSSQSFKLSIWPLTSGDSYQQMQLQLRPAVTNLLGSAGLFKDRENWFLTCE